jgi:ElaB/YqjD/DUF883 family membrane-anchored ribosome-binding protein
MTNSTNSTIDQFADTAKRAAHNGANLAEDAIKKGEDYIRKGVETSKAKLNDAVDITASRVEEAHAFITRQAREKPVQTTAIAVGAGLLLGMFLTSGRRR